MIQKPSSFLWAGVGGGKNGGKVHYSHCFPQALAVWFRGLPGSRFPGFCNGTGKHLWQCSHRLGSLPPLLHPYVCGPADCGDTERRRIKERAGWSVLNSAQCFPNRRVWLGGRPHAHNILHSFQKRRKREGGEACFEMGIRKTVSALATVLLQGFEPQFSSLQDYFKKQSLEIHLENKMRSWA